MLMPPDVRETFMPNPPLAHIAPSIKRRKQEWSGVSGYLSKFETCKPCERKIQPNSQSKKQEKVREKKEASLKALKPQIEAYRRSQKESGGEFEGMNCYNTLFIGRLAFEMSERKLLREMEGFGPVKDIRIVKDKAGNSKGYAFVEYEHEEDMKRAYRAADGMRCEGRDIVADVERGHTVPSWLPRRLGGGLGGTRLGGKEVNVTFPGRFDPSRPEPSPSYMGGMDRPEHPPQGRGGHFGMGRGGGYGAGPMFPHPPLPPNQRGDWDRDHRKRHRSPERGAYYGDRTASRRRY